MREVIATGRTVEEATEKGCAELGLSRDEVSVEIVEMPVKKLFKSTPAKVKVTAAADDSAQPAPQQQATPPQPQPQKAPAAQPKEERPQPAAASAPILPAEPEEEIDLAQNPRVKQAVDYLASIFAAMGAGDTKITAVRQGEATLLQAEEGQISEKMEIRGEVIQALSYLIDRSVNAGVDKKEDDYLRIRLDIAGYRNRREAELIALANRVGKEVAKTARSKTLPPMNPYERLIVHTAISSIDGIVSESIGADIERRVVIKSTAPNATDGGDWRAPRPGGGRGGRPNNNRGGRGSSGGRGGQGRGPRSGGGNRDGRDGRDNRPRPGSAPPREEPKHNPAAGPVVPQRREAIRDGEDLPLYGKIEL